jgi:hypothetical protein
MMLGAAEVVARLAAAAKPMHPLYMVTESNIWSLACQATDEVGRMLWLLLTLHSRLSIGMVVHCSCCAAGLGFYCVTSCRFVMQLGLSYCLLCRPRSTQ